jgi:ADP-ribose pyrophosphatase YjhB (NUDIX family)
LIYIAALRARELLWAIQRPTLLGVRALVVRRTGAEHEILLIRHRAGRKPWALPGGGVERHERSAEAARREVFEEAGLPVRVERLLGFYDAFRGEFTNYIAVFVCEALGEPNPPESLEIAEARFFPAGALPPALDDGSRRRIAEYLRGESGVSELW